MSGRYGECFETRPVIVIPFDNADKAEEFKAYAESFVPSKIVGAEAGKDEEFKMIKEAFIRPQIKWIGNEIIFTWDSAIDEVAATIGPFTAVTAGLNCSIKGSLAFAQPV